MIWVLFRCLITEFMTLRTSVWYVSFVTCDRMLTPSRIPALFMIPMQVYVVLFGICRNLFPVSVDKFVICMQFVRESIHPWLRLCKCRLKGFANDRSVLIPIDFKSCR